MREKAERTPMTRSNAEIVTTHDARAYLETHSVLIFGTKCLNKICLVGNRAFRHVAEDSVCLKDFIYVGLPAT